MPDLIVIFSKLIKSKTVFNMLRDKNFPYNNLQLFFIDVVIDYTILYHSFVHQVFVFTKWEMVSLVLMFIGGFVFCNVW